MDKIKIKVFFNPGMECVTVEARNEYEADILAKAERIKQGKSLDRSHFQREMYDEEI